MSPATPRHVRYRCDLHAQLHLGGPGALPVRVLELSESGAFIEEAFGLEDVQVGDPGTLTLAMPTGDLLPTPVRVTRHGRSRRELRTADVDNVTVSVPGVGVEFFELPDEELERLRDYLELLDGR